MAKMSKKSGGPVRVDEPHPLANPVRSLVEGPYAPYLAVVLADVLKEWAMRRMGGAFAPPAVRSRSKGGELKRGSRPRSPR